MKIRKQQFPPPPENRDPVEVQGARLIAACVAQGLPGEYFATLLNANDPKKVEDAAAMSVHELSDWFKTNQEAREILDKVPQFPQFVADLHRAARAMYPNAAKRAG